MKKLEKDVTNLYRSLLNKEFIAKKVAELADPTYRLSAMNLVRYITLRNQDLRNVHDSLHNRLEQQEHHVYSTSHIIASLFHFYQMHIIRFASDLDILKSSSKYGALF